MESTSEIAGPLTRFRWNSNLVYSYTVLHRLWRLIPCCLVLFAVTGCHRAQKKVVTEHHYVSPSDTLMITYPPDWKENPLKMTKVIDVVLSAPDNAGSLFFAESSNFDAPMLDLDTIYETYLIYNRFLDFNLTIVSNMQTNVAGFAAMKMYGYRDGRPVEAFLIQNDFHIYELFAVPDADAPDHSFFLKKHTLLFRRFRSILKKRTRMRMLFYRSSNRISSLRAGRLKPNCAMANCCSPHVMSVWIIIAKP